MSVTNNAQLHELFDIFPSLTPRAQTTPNNGQWMNLSPHYRGFVLAVHGAGTPASPANDSTLSFQEADSAAGGNAQALTLDGYWRKMPGTNADLSPGASWVRVDEESSSYTDGSWNGRGVLLLFSIPRLSSGFTHTRITQAGSSSSGFWSFITLADRRREGTQELADYTL